jgi:hypothetical protein
MDFGEKKILIEKGEKVYLAVVLHGKREANIPQKMRDVLEAIEKEYGPVLSQWDGDYEKVRGIKDGTQSIFKVSPFINRKAKAD